MDLGVSDEVLYVGERESATSLAGALEGCLVRWAPTAGDATALLDRLASNGRSLDCLVLAVDDPSPFELARARWSDVTCLSVAPTGPSSGEQVPEDDLAHRVAGALAPDGDLGYPVASNEDARLEEVRSYECEPVFDAPGFERLAGLARRLLEAQVGFVGLLDDTHLRVVGCDGDYPETIAREESICAFTVLDEGPLVVEDVAHDPRFADIDRLADLGVRAYAGVPVHGRTGQAIGTVCVTDTIPRAFADRDVERLELLAAETADQFELRRRVAEEASPAVDVG